MNKLKNKGGKKVEEENKLKNEIEKELEILKELIKQDKEKEVKKQKSILDKLLIKYLKDLQVQTKQKIEIKY